MRVISQIQTRPSPSCCFGALFSKEQSNTKDIRKDLKKRLNLMMLNTLHPVELPDKDKDQEITRRSTFRNLVMEESPRTTPNKNYIRTQSLPKTPKPQPVLFLTTKSPVNVSERFFQTSSRVSSHSLQRKNQPLIKKNSSNQIKISISQQTQSRSTATSKQPQSALRKHQNVFPIFQKLDSSQSVEFGKRNKLAVNSLSKITALCSKQLKKSIYYQADIINCPRPSPKFDLLNQIPSSQLPGQFAISRQPSFQRLSLDEQQQKIKTKHIEKLITRQRMRNIIMNH